MFTLSSDFMILLSSVNGIVSHKIQLNQPRQSGGTKLQSVIIFIVGGNSA